MILFYYLNWSFSDLQPAVVTQKSGLVNFPSTLPNEKQLEQLSDYKIFENIPT